VLVPYLEGERTPNLPNACGALHGMTLQTSSPAYVARAAVEGLLCGLESTLQMALRAKRPGCSTQHLTHRNGRYESAESVARQRHGTTVR
jgi:xylulokinase